MRVGVFGGSFDPVHLGHLTLADCCWRQAKLDRVEFTPAGRQPHKPEGPVASNAHRVAMLQLAVQDRPQFSISTREVDRDGMSYTVDTLRDLHRDVPGAELFFLMGADSLADFPNWREPQVICELATLLVVRRAGLPEPEFGVLEKLIGAARTAEIRAHEVEMPATLISSSQIRRMIAANMDWRSLVPPLVAGYIERERLYRQ